MAFGGYDLNGVQNTKITPIKPPILSFNTLIVTWFYIGLLGIAPGTMASLATYPIYYGIITSTFVQSLNDLRNLFYGAAIIAFLIGWWATHIYQKKTNTFDHSSVVIDEVAGMMIVFALCYEKLFKVSVFVQTQIALDMKTTNVAFLLVFFIFRFFDIFKPLFLSTLDHMIKNAFGVMFDDAVAAIYTAITILIINGIQDRFY